MCRAKVSFAFILKIFLLEKGVSPCFYEQKYYICTQ